MASFAEAALADGGVGGRDALTPHTVSKNPGNDGRNQIRFIKGRSAGLSTINGVIVWPSTRPSGLDMPKIMVARLLSDC